MARGNRERVSMLRRGRHEQSFDTVVDRHDAEALRQVAQAWLEAGRWDEDLWGDFTIRVGSTEVRAA